MAHDTVPSAPALPIFKLSSASTQPAIPTELRVIVEDFKRLRTEYAAKVLPNDPPEWKHTSSDVFEGLEIQKANRMLAQGRTIEDASSVLAAGMLCRIYGAQKTRDALRRR